MVDLGLLCYFKNTQQKGSINTHKYFFDVEGSVGRLHRNVSNVHDMARHIGYMRLNDYSELKQEANILN
jgi:hypothetical protein